MNSKCQVFTPSNYVEELLNYVEYQKNLFGKKVLENSCGDGNVLLQIVSKYIDDCISSKRKIEEIKSGLENDIYAFEIDINQFNKCIQNLNNLVSKYELNNVNWRIYNQDFLRWKSDVKFDFIIGNPPYIKYKDIKIDERKYLKDNYISCKDGKFDYCYAFIEKSVLMMNDNCKMSYLVPNSIFKTVFGYNLREIIRKLVIEIVDYSHVNIFDKALVKSSILVLGKFENSNYFKFTTLNKNTVLNVEQRLNKDKWSFSNYESGGSRRFGDYYSVSHVIATLYNKAFVIKDEVKNEDNTFIYFGSYKLEKELVRKTATPRSLKYEKSEYIIFPYSVDNDKVKKIKHEDFKFNYPNIYRYLKKHKKELEKRNSDNLARWFEYGRSQGLNNILKQKLLLSTVITKKVRVYMLESSSVPYAGMFIVPKENTEKYNLDFAKQILESENFLIYAMKCGISISGESIRITSKDILDFMF